MRFTRKEVEEFLMENGFDDPDEETLRKFMKDLQKLIKYDEQRRRRQLLGHERDDTVLDTTAHTSANVTSLNSPDQNTSGHNNGHRSLGVSRGTGEDIGGGRRSINQSSENELTQLEPGKTKTVIRNRRKSDDVTDLKGNSTVVSVPKESAQEKYDRLLASMSERKSDPDPAPPSAKQGNRLIMKRLTFTQGEDGASFIEESDVDLGRRRQNLRPNRPNPARPATQTRGLSQTVEKSDFDSVRRRRLTSHSSTQEVDRTRRPQTAPASQRTSQSKGAHTVPVDQRGAVSRSNSDQPDNAILPETNSLEDIEPDELFYALNELIFPSRSESSDESASTTSEKYKSLPQPPPHVAIDPVSLYHWYKTYSWDVFSVPGEDKHMKLRWNVRAKTIGGNHPCVDARRIVRRPQSSRPARNPMILKQCA